MGKTLILADDVNHYGHVTDVFETAEGSRLWTIANPDEVSEFTEEDFDVEQSPHTANCWQVSNLIKTRDMTVSLLQLDKFDCELIHELNEEN